MEVDLMEYLGVFAFIMVLSYMGLPDKVKKLNKRVKILERKNIKKEVNRMSEIISSLVGERCKLKDLSGIASYEGTILAVDEEWVKINVVKNKNESIVVMRIEDIKEIKMI